MLTSKDRLSVQDATGGQFATKTSLSSGLPTDKIAQAINNVDFKLGLENASASMIREHIMKNDDREEMRRLVQYMGDNEFFKQFASKYQKGLSRALKNSLDSADGDTSSPSKTKKKADGVPSKLPKKVNFGKMIMEHVSNNNFYRKNLPAIFTSEAN